MAPEIINRNYFDYKADIWSAGIVLFEMIHGKRPYRSDDVDRFKSIQRFEIEFPKNISNDLKVLISQLLTLD